MSRIRTSSTFVNHQLTKESERQNSAPPVSAIIIFWNARTFLEEAVSSVLAQTYSHWELILVDDGSTDGSTSLAQKYTRQRPGQIQYRQHPHHQNRGMSASRNLGIRNARGKYIAFLDADDVWLPQKLERQVAVMEAHPEAAVVCGPTQFWHSWTGHPRDLKRDRVRKIHVQPDTLHRPPRLLELFLRDRVLAPATCSLLVRRSALESIGGFEEQFRGMYEDQAFMAKVYHRLPVYIMGACLDKYRQHRDSCCANAKNFHHLHSLRPNPSHRAFLDWLQAYLKEQGENRPRITKALNWAYFRYSHPLLFYLGALSQKVRQRITQFQ